MLVRKLVLLQSAKPWVKEGLLVVAAGHEPSQWGPDCPGGLVGPYLPAAAAAAVRVETSYQRSLLARTAAAKPAVAAPTEASEACLARGAGASESPLTSGAFDEAGGLGSVLARASWRRAQRHSEGRRWAGLLWTLGGRWGEAQHC